MTGVFQRVSRVAEANVPVLILGESGTGKEILARYIHSQSNWHDGPFVKVNCPAIPGTLLESELFGYQKGAFTGAYASKPGLVEKAQNGTLFLDEIAELDANLQAKLLNLLQDGQFCRIGDHVGKRVDARVVCATNRNLEREISTGNFRQDLYYRINVISITLPPLRERREDIPVLIEHMLRKFNARFHRNTAPISKEAVSMLQQRGWPGNIRELENCIARYVVLGTEEALGLSNGDQPRTTGSVTQGLPLDGSIPLKQLAQRLTRQMERELILKVLQNNNWNRRRTAEVLQISYRALLYKVRQAGLPPKRAVPKPAQPDQSLPHPPTPGD